MIIRFNDGTIKEQPFDVERMARLIRISEKHNNNVGFRVELNPNRSIRERQAQVKRVEDYLHWLDVNNK